jgi:hypothetical protein
MSDEAKAAQFEGVQFNCGAEFYAALAKAQGEFESAELDAENPAFKRGGKVSRYATIGSAIVASRKALTKHGFVVLQPLVDCEGGVRVVTHLAHSSGQSITSAVKYLIPNMTVQTMIGASTYLRRVSLVSTLVLVTGGDDDGNETAAHEAANQPPTNSRAPAHKPDPTPWQRCLLLGVQHGVDQKQLGAIVKTLANRSKPTEVTAGDVGLVAAYLAPGPGGSPSKFEQDEIKAKENGQ